MRESEWLAKRTVPQEVLILFLERFWSLAFRKPQYLLIIFDLVLKDGLQLNIDDWIF